MRLTVFFCLLALQQLAWAGTGRYRLSYRDDPSTTMVIGWSGDNATVYYDTIDRGQNWQQYAQSRMVDRSVNHRGMNNYFVRLTGLRPGKVYYFVIKDNSGTGISRRLSFRTISDRPEDPISFISGGDSREGVWPVETCNCRSVRQEGMRLVAKIRPDFIAFNGDYVINTPLLANGEWQEWMDDWQLTISPDGRMTPIIPSVGNHETEEDVFKLFDVPGQEIYYAINFGTRLFRFYSLNSETDACTDTNQLNWFQNDLQQHSTPSNTPYWKLMQYHIPMLPQAEYGTRNDMIQCWLPLLAQHGVRLVMESHAHVMKTTYPLVASSAPGNHAGFIRNDSIGAVFIGDGSWGAPLRAPYTPFPTTKGTAAENGFFFVRVSMDTIHVQTVLIRTSTNVAQLTDDEQGSGLPSGVTYWNNPGAETYIIRPRPVTTSIEAVPSVLPKAQLFPNPTQSEVTIQFEKALTEEGVRIEIYDARGQRCRSLNNITGQQYRLDVSDLCSGVNYVHIVGKKDVQALKLIIAR